MQRGITQTQRTGSTQTPPARKEAGFVYDSARAVCTLFGGATLAGGGNIGDTWDWDGSQWTQRQSNGPSRSGHAMAYDSVRSRIVTFGGGSPSVTARVLEAPAADILISQQPPALTNVAYQGTASITVAASGTGPMTYQWRK